MFKNENKHYFSITKLLAMVLIMASVMAMIPVQSFALSNNVHDILFDWEYYYNTNADVARAFGRNQSALRNHYNSYGKREGRAPSELFEPKTYLGLYADLRAAFGNDYTKAYNHFVSYGINEGRKASNKFDVSVYKANYADLRAAFGNNNLKYLKHYREYGKREGRNAVSSLGKSSASTSSKPSSSGASSSGSSSAVTNLENGAYYLINYKNTNMGVNVQFAPPSGIGNLVLDSTSNREGNEVWKFTYNSSYKAYYITPKYRSGAAMNALYGASAQKGSQARLHDSNINDTASLWKVEKSGNYYRFKNIASGYYLDVAAGKTSTGTRINIWSSDTSTQLFSLTKVSAGSTPSSSSSGNTKFVWPVGGSGGYDNKNWPKYNSSGKYHSGTDISASKGTPVYAAYGGTVDTAKSLTSSYGKHVIIRCNVDGKTVYMYYAHMNSYNVRVGQTVSAGQQIGTVGSTGNSTGPHLHFEVRNSSKHYGNINNPTLNPYNYLPKR